MRATREKTRHNGVEGVRPVLITGGCGFIGSNLADTLASGGTPVLALDSLGRDGSRENAQWLKKTHGHLVDIRRVDVCDAEALQSLVARASAVLHLAGQVAVTTSLKNPIGDFEINARGTLNVLEAMRLRNPQAPVLFASTNKVYGHVLGGNQVRRERERYVPAEPGYEAGISEAARLDFHSPYGCSKGAADQYVRDYARVFGLRAAVLRMSCIYGPRQFGTEDQGWIAHFFLRALRDEPITIYGDGYQVRDALHVRDAVAAWLAVLADVDRACGRAFNLGGGTANSVSLRELLGLMERIGRRPAEIEYRGWRPGDQPWYISDTRALRQTLAWEPRVSLLEGLGSLNNWLSFRFGTKHRRKADLVEAQP
jgi:CDP-paratose 2-epimerase